MLRSHLVRKATLLLLGMWLLEFAGTESVDIEFSVVENDLDEATADSSSIDVPLDGYYAPIPSRSEDLAYWIALKWIALSFQLMAFFPHFSI
jgi:hypothetical protein